MEGNKGFYQDKATVDDMGEKKMFEEKSGIGKSEVLGEATVIWKVINSLNLYQTQFMF